MAAVSPDRPLALLTELVEQLGELYTAETAQIAELRAELATVHSELAALSNRIESCFRVIDSRTGHLA